MQKIKTAKEIAISIRRGGIGVMPTDTLYGLVGSAFLKKAVEKIYRVRKRNKKKPMIVLISAIGDLNAFGIKLDRFSKSVLDRYWPGPVSIILSCKHKNYEYVHRGTKTIAFRLPKAKWLISILKKTGPLVAPSANSEGKKPAKTIYEAKRYFGNRIDFYQDKGRQSGKSSRVISIEKKNITVVRERE